MIKIVVFIFFFVIAGGNAASADVSGSVCVIDGDLISINGHRFGHECKDGTIVRLHGIDAPELDQKCISEEGAIFKCGLYAASFLLDHVQGKTLECRGNTQNVKGHWLLRCYIDEENLNAYMVSEGWALSYEMLSRRYQPQEVEAKEQKKGVWVFDFVNPWEWRKGKRLPGMTE